MDSKPPHLRLFVCIHVPEEVRDNLRAIQKQFDKQMPNDAVRWTSFEQLHLTLEFLGNIPADHLSPLQQALAKVAAEHRAFAIAAQTIGAFSSVRNPRVIWAGLTGEIDRLKALQADAHASVVQWEKEPESRPYRPHLTLGRVRPAKPRELRKVTQALASVESADFGKWRATEFSLMQSKLSPHGAQHSVLATFPLQP